MAPRFFLVFQARDVGVGEVQAARSLRTDERERQPLPRGPRRRHAEFPLKSGADQLLERDAAFDRFALGSLEEPVGEVDSGAHEGKSIRC